MATKKRQIPKSTKRGRLSNEEIGFIKEKAGTLGAEAIAKKMGRAPEQIQREIDKLTGVKKPEVRMNLEVQLESRPEWKQFTKQFTNDELSEFKHQYVQMVSTQFKDDLMPTEELVLFQVITLKILIDRTLEEQRMAVADMHASHMALEDLRAEGSGADKDEVMVNEVKYDSAKKTNKECADRYKIYSDKQDKMFQALKATRDQRVTIKEGSKQSFLGWVRFLMEEEARERMGEEMEMMRLAAEKEKKRLGKPHTYQDGAEDQPLLTPETVLWEDEAEGQA